MNKESVVSQHIQECYVRLVITDTKFLKKFRNKLKASWFSSQVTIDIVTLCYSYFDRFKEAPGSHLYDECDKFLRGEKDEQKKTDYNDFLRRICDMDEPSEEYVTSTFSKFAQARVMEECCMEAAPLVERGQFEKAKPFFERALNAGVGIGEGVMTCKDVDSIPDTIEQTDWFWEPVIPRNTLTILAGAPKVGKGMLCSYLISCLTTGRPFPHTKVQEKGKVAILAYEDTGRTLKWRVKNMGGTFTNETISLFDGIVIQEGVEKLFHIDKDIAILRQFLEADPDIKLLIIDPLNDFTSSSIDTHKDSSVRLTTTPLIKLADDLQVTILACHHVRKGSGEDNSMLDMVMGSRAYTASARSIWVLEKSNDLYTLACAGSNFVDERISYPYSMMDNIRPDADGKSLEFNWFQPSEDSADDIKAARLKEHKEKRSPKLTEATQFLLVKLRSGPVSADGIAEAAYCLNITKDTLDRAAKEVGVKKTKNGVSGEWSWSLPDT